MPTTTPFTLEQINAGLDATAERIAAGDDTAQAERALWKKRREACSEDQDIREGGARHKERVARAERRAQAIISVNTSQSILKDLDMQREAAAIELDAAIPEFAGSVLKVLDLYKQIRQQAQQQIGAGLTNADQSNLVLAKVYHQLDLAGLPVRGIGHDLASPKVSDFLREQTSGVMNESARHAAKVVAENSP